MTTQLEKKITARQRWTQVAEDFKNWLSANPDASQERKVKAFDAICDARCLQ